MQLIVEAWDPDYGSSIDLTEPDEVSVEDVETEIEDRPWGPIRPPEQDVPDSVAFIDGTRRLDALVFVADAPDETPVPGAAGSVGVGAVLCRAAHPAEIVVERVVRHLAVCGGRAMGLTAGPGLEYRPLPVPGMAADRLMDAIHNEMRNEEAALAQELASDGSFVFVDGPLAVFDPGARRIVGYIKSHSKRYLPPDEERVVGRLDCGQRTPLFAFGDRRPRYSWYLRLCDSSTGRHGWHGIARCEVPAALPLDAAVRLADLSSLLLPTYASPAYWDPRAPQNLVPVAGLERRLRHLLGDRDLVLRMIRSAAARVEREEVTSA